MCHTNIVTWPGEISIDRITTTTETASLSEQTIAKDSNNNESRKKKCELSEEQHRYAGQLTRSQIRWVGHVERTPAEALATIAETPRAHRRREGRGRTAGGGKRKYEGRT